MFFAHLTVLLIGSVRLLVSDCTLTLAIEEPFDIP